jgi:NAD(P)-dependent dehydrogenase (short-subunit alcohol dehydrogenase family)
MRLINKISIITGSGSGIGRGIALAFAKEGAKVIVADCAEEGGLETVKQIENDNGEAVFIKTDVSKADDVCNMVKICLDKYGRVDILVNNAAIVKNGSLHEISENDWNMVLDVNLKGVFLSSRTVIPEMLKIGKGKIINISSIAGLVGIDKSCAYSASKGGIIALSREMAIEYGRNRINVNCIAPGTVRTPATEHIFSNNEQKRNIENVTPYPRLGVPEDIAMAAVYLASDESDFVTGEVLVVDGGCVAK